MKWKALAAAAAFTISTSVGAAPGKPRVEGSPDLLRPQPLRKAPRLVVPEVMAAAAAAPSVDDVGDPDSFGRNVTYLGLTQTLPVAVQADCSGSDPTLERCVVSATAPATTAFNEADLATINLPARSTRSLLCFTLTPFVSVDWANHLGAPAAARFSASAMITIENEVLADPALVDPSTGLPFGGSLTLPLSTYHSAHTLQPGEVDSKTLFMTRSCIAGLIAKRSLVENFGLTETQATQFFRRPMTIRFGSRGSVGLTDFATYFYGIRLYGD